MMTLESEEVCRAEADSCLRAMAGYEGQLGFSTCSVWKMAVWYGAVVSVTFSPSLQVRSKKQRRGASIPDLILKLSHLGPGQ